MRHQCYTKPKMVLGNLKVFNIRQISKIRLLSYIYLISKYIR